MTTKYKSDDEIPGREMFNNVKVDGFNMTPGFVQGRETLDNWNVDEEDVWIAGLPKAGTTWTQEMVWLIVNDLDFEGAKVSIQERSPQWEDSTFMDIRPIGVIRDVEIPLFRADSLRFIQETKQKGKPMCIKTHLPFVFLPKAIRDGSKQPKIVSVSRNPKDTCVSMYHFLKNLAGLESSLEDFAKNYISEAFFGPPWEHTISYWTERHRSNLLILQYEEMIEDLPAVLRKVAEFLGKKYTEEQFEKLAKHLSFQSMKNNTAVNFTNIFQLTEKLGLSVGGKNFLRSGKIGSYKEELSSEIIKEFDKISLEKYKESGWNFL